MKVITEGLRPKPKRLYIEGYCVWLVVSRVYSFMFSDALTIDYKFFLWTLSFFRYLLSYEKYLASDLLISLTF